MKILLSILLISFFSLFSNVAESATFQAGFVKLNLPPGWKCEKEEQDWVCLPENEIEKKEVLLIVVNKSRDVVDDSLEKYVEVLNTPRAMKDLAGNQYQAQIKYTLQKEIGGQMWADSLQLGPEIPGFYTRYVASVKENIAALVTYSIPETLYAKHAPIMDRIIDGLELTFDQKTYDEALKSGGSLLGARTQGRNRTAPKQESESATQDQPSGGLAMEDILAILIIGGVVGFIIWKRKRG